MIDLLSGSHLKVTGQGRISRLGKLQSYNGKRFFKFSVAHNLRKHVEYVNYVAYDKQADYLERYATTGTSVYVESVPHTNRYQDPKSDKEKFISKTIYQVEALSFIGNTKYTTFKEERSLTEHELKEIQDGIDPNINNVAIKMLEADGYIITKENSDEDK